MNVVMIAGASRTHHGVFAPLRASSPSSILLCEEHDMLNHDSVLDPSDFFRRPGTARRELTRAPVVPSQDVSRYPARDMPPPTYDLDREEAPASSFPLLVLALAVTVTGAGIALIERIGTWLSR
jgi:hypothetical protein